MIPPERLSHPANQCEANRKPPFNAFFPFINLNGLSSRHQVDFIRILSHLYDLNGATWLAGSCTDFVNTYLEFAQPYQALLGTISGKRYRRRHFWLEGSLTDKVQAIIDPCGGPESDSDWGKYHTYLPYFGLIQHAPRCLRECYRNSRPVERWGASQLKMCPVEDE